MLPPWQSRHHAPGRRGVLFQEANSSSRLQNLPNRDLLPRGDRETPAGRRAFGPRHVPVAGNENPAETISERSPACVYRTWGSVCVCLLTAQETKFNVFGPCLRTPCRRQGRARLTGCPRSARANSI